MGKSDSDNHNLEMNSYSHKPSRVANDNKLPLFTTSRQHCCQETCLHKVARNGDSSKLFELLKHTNETEVTLADQGGRTALHWVAIKECICDCCLDQAEKCAGCLLESGIDIDVNCQDADGNTPLHLAVQYGNTKVAKLLLDKRVDINIRNNNGQEAWTLIAQNSPEIMVDLLNRAITIDESYPNSKNCVLRLDLSAVTGNYNTKEQSTETEYHRELSLLTQLLNASKRSRRVVFTHPLVILFLAQKFRRVKKYYVMLFFCYLFWLLCYTSFIIKVYLLSCPCETFSKEMKLRSGRIVPEEMTAEVNRCQLETGFTGNACLVLVLTFVMAVNEILKIITIPRFYFKSKMSLGNWALIFMVIVTTAPVIMKKNSKLESWQYEAAALAIFLAWAFILRQLGTFPSLGRYVEILGHVLRTFTVSMLTFSSLFLAFALALNVLFPGTGSFSHLFFAVAKCLMMFIGEVDYQDMFFDKAKEDATGPIVGHVLYVGFVLIISVVLMNLLVGLAVRDIQALEKQAELTRVFRQISEMLSLESTIFSSSFPKPLNRFLQKMISVTGHKKVTRSSNAGCFERSAEERQPCLKNIMHLRPNEHTDKQAPEKLKKALLKIAIGNYHQSSSQKSGHG